MGPYGAVRAAVAAVLKVPLAPPEPPPGDHSLTLAFRASSDWLRYRMTIVAAALVPQAFGVVVGDTVVSSAIFRKGIDDWAALLVVLLSVLAFGGLIFWATLQFLLTRLDYDLRYYLVTDRCLRIREGALVVRELTITFANVQNLRLVQGPLMRLFDLWDLVVETAGGGTGEEAHGGATDGHRARLRGLADPHAVRALILERLRKEKGAGLGDPDDSRAHAAVPRLSPAHLARLREIRDALLA